LTQNEFDIAMTERAKMLGVLASVLLGLGIVFLVFDIHDKAGFLLLTGAIVVLAYLLGLANTMVKYYKEKGWRMT